MKRYKRALRILTLGLVIVFAFLVLPAVSDSGQKASANTGPYTLIYYDGHMHTTRSDGNGSVAQIKATALARGLSAVIITDHCKDLTLAEWNSLVAETAAASEPGVFLALPGFEMTGSEGIFNRGHMNALNTPDPFVGNDADLLCPEEVWPDPFNPAGTGPMFPENFAEWANYVHSQGGIIQHNHTSGTTLLDYGVDVIELYNQGHVDDIMYYATALGIPPADAWEFAITMNDFAVYGERDLNMTVTLPGFPPMPLRLAIYMATQFIPPNVGQIIGWNPPTPPNPYVPGDLNSWDELLMAYVDGTVAEPIFGTANSDSHNTGDPGSTVGTGKNGLYVEELTAEAFYDAIEAGRSFATDGPSLDFNVNGDPMGSTTYNPMGVTAELNLSAASASPTAILVKIDIIKNGAIWQTLNPMSPTYAGTVLDADVTENGYYRVEVTSLDMATGAYYFAWSNPVFVSTSSGAVGGMVEHLVGADAPAAASASSSGSDYALPLAAAVAGTVVVTLAAGWYARRRRWAR
jgi:hypothetical protein